MAGISHRVPAFGKHNRYRYNGKDEQKKKFVNGSGLEWYDYGAGLNDNQTTRWMRHDPLSEISRRLSP